MPTTQPTTCSSAWKRAKCAGGTSPTTSPDGPAGDHRTARVRPRGHAVPPMGAPSVSRVELDGNDNTTFRLGDALSVRLPSDDAYVDKEHRWLPYLAPLCRCRFPSRSGAAARRSALSAPGRCTGCDPDRPR